MEATKSSANFAVASACNIATLARPHTRDCTDSIIKLTNYYTS